MDDEDEEQGITQAYDGDEYFDLDDSGSNDSNYEEEDGGDEYNGGQRIVMPTSGHATVTLERDSVLHISIPRKRRRPLEIVLERESGSRDETVLQQQQQPGPAEICEDHEPPPPSSSNSSCSDSDPRVVDDDKVWNLLPRPAPADHLPVVRSEAQIVDEGDFAQQSSGVQEQVRPAEENAEGNVEEQEEEVYDALEAEVAAEPSSKVAGFAAAAESKDDDGDVVVSADDDGTMAPRFPAAAAETVDEKPAELDEEEEEEVEFSTRALRFAAIEKPLATSSAKRAVRFHAPEFDEEEGEEEEDRDEAAGEKKKPEVKLVRFADAAATPKKKKSVRFARGTRGGGGGPKPKVRFDADAEGGERRKKASLESPKVVRFLLPTMDAASGKPRMRIFLPGVQRVGRRNTIKLSTLRVYPDPPLSLVLGLMETERFRHLSGSGRAKACQVLGVAGTVLSALGLLVCLVMLAVYFHLRPRIPHLRIEDFDVFVLYELLDEDTLVMQQVEDRGNYYFYRAVVYGMFMASYRNLNSAVDLYNYYVESSVFYHGSLMGTSRVRNFVVPRKSDMPLEFHISNEMLVPLQVGYTMLKELGALHIVYVCEFIIKARMSPPGSLLTSRLFWHRVRCYIELTEDTMDQMCHDYNY